MSYRRTWPKNFLNSEFIVDPGPWPTTPPQICPDHVNCFKCYNAWNQPMTTGTWRLLAPINPQNVMLGERQKLLTISISGLYRNWNCPWFDGAVEIGLTGDGAELHPWTALNHGNNKWQPNIIAVNKMIDTITELDIKLNQWLDAHIGAFEFHDATISILCEYYTTVPPSKGDLEITVIDADKRTPLSNVNVRILSGYTLVREGYTDESGRVTFTSVDEGGYMLHVAGVEPTYWSGGYQGLDITIEIVAAATNVYTVELVPLSPLSRIPVPWYVWLGAGVVAIGGIYYFLKPRMPPVYVVR